MTRVPQAALHLLVA